MKKKNKNSISEENIKKDVAELEKHEQGSDSFPIVGIGASAGGLEAFTQLLNALPEDIGMSFMCVQHLSPHQESILPELLSKETQLQVLQAKDGLKILRNHVYIIPPNSVMTLIDGSIKLESRELSDSPFLPVDNLFRSLAEIQKYKAIGIILSGTGTDGTLGIKAIKAEGGITFAQEGRSAKYDGMPRSAIATGEIDFVLSPSEIALELTRIGKHPYVALTRTEKIEEILPEEKDGFNKIFKILRSATDVDFTHYKLNTIQRRISRRLVLHKIENITEYIDFLKENPHEVENLYHDILINVTNFFRDPSSYEILQDVVFPRVMSYRKNDSSFRIWVPGCSTGEEAYSIAIALLEYLGDDAYKTQIQIFATDVSEAAVEKARTGSYPDNIIQEVSPERLQRFFVRTNGGYQVNKSVRALCVFARQDISKDPPFSRIDIISCRNLLIYLTSALQKKIIPAFHYALNPHGILFLGNSESIGGFADLFQLIDKKHKIYEKKQIYHNVDLNFSLTKNREKTNLIKKAETPAAVIDIEKEADRLLISKYTPASILINEDMNILQFRGNTGIYLQPAAGSASFNLFKMTREGLTFDLRSAVHKAKKENAPVRRNNVKFSYDNENRIVDIEVIPIKNTQRAPEVYFLILFHGPDNTKEAGENHDFENQDTDDINKLGKLEDELQATKEYLESIIEQKEAFNEELRSALEELQSSNEELQSTNEEMETAKEELQSTNEELSTVNDELADRNEELSKANNDLINLLGSINIPVIMLSNDLKIRRFTPASEKVLNIIAGDIGRSISDLRFHLDIPNLSAMILDVLQTLETKEMHVHDDDDNWYLMKIRPYRTMDNKIDGVVIAFFEISHIKQDLRKSEEALTFAQSIIDTLNQPFLILSADLKIKSANRSFYTIFDTSPELIEDHYLYNISNGLWYNSNLNKYLKNIFVPDDITTKHFAIDIELKDKGKANINITARKLLNPEFILLMMEINHV
jgi:two-component system CheB/CheR fusion protein